MYNCSGPTGCGKSSLLDILADRKNSQGLTGRILLDGMPRDPSFKYNVGYVVQEDIITGTLTVRENLMFSANVRLPKTVSVSDRAERVTKVINDLGLESCADTRIGTEFLRGVSGGERRRACIGMELVLSPTILFLEEPTKGLYCLWVCKIRTSAQHISNKVFLNSLDSSSRVAFCTFFLF